MMKRETMKTIIVIPARYNSSRFPGKPLALISNKPMLQRVYEIAEYVCKNNTNTDVIVATDNLRIQKFCQSINASCVLTSEDCNSGTDRALDAIQGLKLSPDYVLNLQGDNPLCPPWVIDGVIKSVNINSCDDVITPYKRLMWSELDEMIKSKEKTPSSGTTVIIDKENYAIWFSKNIIPAIRNRKKLVENDPVYSPINRHIGIYCYRLQALKKFAETPCGYYEELEQLEQLRFIENGMKIRMVEVDYRNRISHSGIDSPEDVEKAEKIIETYGELI